MGRRACSRGPCGFCSSPAPPGSKGLPGKWPCLAFHIPEIRLMVGKAGVTLALKLSAPSTAHATICPMGLVSPMHPLATGFFPPSQCLRARAVAVWGAPTQEAPTVYSWRSSQPVLSDPSAGLGSTRLSQTAPLALQNQRSAGVTKPAPAGSPALDRGQTSTGGQPPAPMHGEGQWGQVRPGSAHSTSPGQSPGSAGKALAPLRTPVPSSFTFARRATMRDSKPMRMSVYTLLSWASSMITTLYFSSRKSWRRQRGGLSHAPYPRALSKEPQHLVALWLRCPYLGNEDNRPLPWGQEESWCHSNL